VKKNNVFFRVTKVRFSQDRQVQLSFPEKRIKKKTFAVVLVLVSHLLLENRASTSLISDFGDVHISRENAKTSKNVK